MSRKYTRQFAEPLGGLVFDSKGERLLAALATTPTASIPGYQPGCLFINTAGAIGSFVYLNTGTLASATWTNIA